MNSPAPILAGLAALWVGACSAPPAQMMTFEQYAHVAHPVPYILECQGPGTLMYVGARHAYADDEQAALIERLWAELRPTAAFNEGGNPPVAPTRLEALQRFGEPGLVRWLAARDNVPVATFEPTPRDEATHLAEAFTPEQIRVFYALRQLSQESRREPAVRQPGDEIVLSVFRWLDDQRAAPGEPRTVEDFRASVARLLPDLEDWTEPPSSLFDPVPWDSGSIRWTNRLSRRASEFRDNTIVDVLTHAASDGHRVFAVIGASHVVMQEPVLRARFNSVTRPLVPLESAP